VTLTGPATIPTSLRSVARAALLTAAITLGAPALGYPAIASAEPNNGGGPGGEWDIGVYDSCIKNHPPLYTQDEVYDWNVQCCNSSGGVWTANHCQAPPAQASSPLGPGQPPARVSVPPVMSAPPLTTSTAPNVSNLPVG